MDVTVDLVGGPADGKQMHFLEPLPVAISLYEQKTNWDTGALIVVEHFYRSIGGCAYLYVGKQELKQT